MARVVGHDSTDFRKSDSANRIAKWMARIRRGNSSLKTDVLSLLLLTFDRIVKKLNDFEGRS